MKTDLKRLEETINRLRTRGSYGRRFGKTFYACQQIVGYLETLPKGSVIPVIIEDYGRLYHMLTMLDDILQERGYGSFSKKGTEIVVNKFGSYVKFIGVSDAADKLRGRDAANPYLIFDLEEAGPQFFNGIAKQDLASDTSLEKLLRFKVECRRVDRDYNYGKLELYKSVYDGREFKW